MIPKLIGHKDLELIYKFSLIDSEVLWKKLVIFVRNQVSEILNHSELTTPNVTITN